MKKITLSLLFGFMSLIGFSQVGLVENFDAGLVLPAGWTSEPGDYFGAVVQVCDGFSQRVNLDTNNTTAHLTSPNIVGQSNGTDLTISFDYKIVDWSAAIDATPPGWGEILVQFSTNDGGGWTTVETINDANHTTSADCANATAVVPAASLPTGSDFKLRIDANWTAGSYYIYVDNISATQVVVDPPSCVTLINPANGSTGVPINSDLEWSAATGIPTGYTLVVGTTSGGTDIVDNEDTGLSTTYDLPTLDYSTTYYVSIVPYNGNGPAVNCPEFSFTTGADPNAPVDCAAGTPINTVYCYTDNETQTWNFQSSDGSPLNVFFNAGEMEACCDEITIYDGTDNTGTVLYDDNNGGDMTGVSVNSTTGFIFIEIDSDGSVNCQANQYTPLNFDVSCIDTTAIPNCNASLTTPVNGEIAADINDDLVWSPASIIVTGYTISIGTTPGGTDVANNVDVGLATTYDPGTLLYETTYYVTITPYNDNGSAVNCTEQSFTTENDPNQVLDCSIGEEVNTVFCYENNDTTTFFFASNDGSPLVVVFNSGTTENGWDELVVTDSDGTVIYNAYGNNGDLTGLVFTSSGDSISVGVTSDGIITSCTNDPWDFTVSCVDTTALPNCNSSLTAPLNGQTDVNENDDLNWSPATIFVTGYTLFMGTTPGGTDILNGVDVGNVLTYDPGTLDFDTTYYVTIVPYNDNGPATGCTEESFTIRADPNQILDCSANESINTVYCYSNNDTMEFNFASNDGSPLAVFFNSGETENNFDELVITDSDGTIIYNAYGNNGDLSGLFFFSTGDSITVGVTSDGSVISCDDDPVTSPWNFDVFCFDPTAPPNCNASITTPTDGAIDVDINTDITWNAASIIVTGYTISIGTTPGGTDIADNVDVGNVLTYDPGTLDNATVYYVTIVPYNDNGPATGCTEESFQTICIPQVVTFNAIGDCDTDPDNPDFVLEVDITDLSGAASIIVSDDQGSTPQTATTTGIVTMGPYAANTVVTITTIKSDDNTCDVISSPITFICPPPPNPCSIIYAGEDVTVDCDDPSTDLTAVYHLFGQDTNTYVINGLDTCPQPSTVGGTPTSLDIDDQWSDVINIGFEFCFFGEVYDEILVGSNGVLSFELANANTGNGWDLQPFGEGPSTLPNTTNASITEGNIFGVGHDIDPSVCGDINYLVIGSAPYRQFVVNYTNVCHFQCNDIQSSSQIILYESSNNIDINVFDKPTCTTWNDGLAVIGVQNIDDTVAFTAPGRNTGVWDATDESWRFAPANGTPNYTFEWFEGTTSLGNSETITVSPTQTTTYTASVTYELCTGGTSTITDDVVVTYDSSGEDDPSFTMTATCDGGTATVTGTPGGTFTFNPVPTDGASIDATTGTVTGGTPGETYTVDYTTNGLCPTSSTQTVTVLPADDASFSMTATCDDVTATVTGTTGGTFAFNPAPSDSAMIDSTTGTITGGTPGETYTVEYTTPGVCPEIDMQTVTLLFNMFDFEIIADCNGAIFELTINPLNNSYDPDLATYTLYDDMNSLIQTNGTGDNVFVLDANNFTPPMSGSSYNYVVEVTNMDGCTEMNTVLVESINCIIPQAISPNNDTYNDNFDVSGYEVTSFEVFNRHGVKVYSKTDGYTNEWFGQTDSGDELPVGTYFYVMKYQGNKIKSSWVYINK